MTREEQALQDDKTRAEIAKLQLETLRLGVEAIHRSAQMSAEIDKLVAEGRQIRLSTIAIPFAAAAGLMGATAALVKIFFT